MKHIILLILLTLGVWAQEVGVPFVLKSISTIDNQKTVLSRNGKQLYSLDTLGKFTVWSLYPFKKINEFHIENASNFELSTDEKSLIITTVKEDMNHNGYPVKSGINLILWNIEKKKKEKTVKLAVPINDITLEKNLFFITKNTLEEWDTQKLEKIKKTDLNITRVLNNQCNWLNHNEPVQVTPYKIVVSPDRTKLLIVFLEDILVVDIKTFTILKTINDAIINPYFWEDKNVFNYGGRYKIDLRTLNIQEYSNAIQHLNEKELLYRKTINGNTALLFMNRTFYDSVTLKAYVTFYEYPDGEWVIITPKGYFNTSSNGRKYIYMKTALGELTLIDDETYQKYHTTLNIGEK